VAPHSVGLTGRHVGGSVVGTRIAQYPNGIAIFEVTCRCGRALRRNSSTLRYAIRHGLSVECQQCRKDSGGGVWETASLLRRVADGGPVYTDYETEDICSEVMEELEATFGPRVERIPLPLYVEPGSMLGLVAADRLEEIDRLNEWDPLWAADALKKKAKAPAAPPKAVANVLAQRPAAAAPAPSSILLKEPTRSEANGQCWHFIAPARRKRG